MPAASQAAHATSCIYQYKHNSPKPHFFSPKTCRSLGTRARALAQRRGGAEPTRISLTPPPAPPAAPKVQAKNISPANMFGARVRNRFGSGRDGVGNLAKHKPQLSVPLAVPNVPTAIQLGPRKKQGLDTCIVSTWCYRTIFGCSQELKKKKKRIEPG